MIDPAKVGHLRGLESHLRARIRGQDEILPKLAAGFCRGAMQLASGDRPKASFLLVGPTGTGKTEAFVTATDYVFGPGRLVSFDMSEFQDEEGASRLIGRDRHDPGALGRALTSQCEGGLLFDEMEKAHPRVLDLFLQMLWQGRVTLSTGEAVRLAGFVIGFTSNIGGAEAMRMASSTPTSITRAVLRSVEQRLRPEFVSRIDEKLVFARLTPAVQEEICGLEATRETNRLRNLGHDLVLSRAALDFLVREGFSPQFGARTLRKTVEQQIQNAVVRSLFDHGAAVGELTYDAVAGRIYIRASGQN